MILYMQKMYLTKVLGWFKILCSSCEVTIEIWQLIVSVETHKDRIQTLTLLHKIPKDLWIVKSYNFKADYGIESFINSLGFYRCFCFTTIFIFHLIWDIKTRTIKFYTCYKLNNISKISITQIQTLKDVHCHPSRLMRVLHLQKHKFCY